MRFASIDIGSNAMRLLLCNVNEQDGQVRFKKNELIRMPIRLGEDAFVKKMISPEKADKLINTLKAFKLLIDVFDVVDYRACATSAMREAANGKELCERIKKEAGINLEIIDGKLEAEMIYSNHIAEDLNHNNSYLYIDVGGGSTELTLFAEKKCVASKSFNVGAIRLLHEQVSKDYWNFFKEWIKDKTSHYHPLIAIGSGGNINKINKMARRRDIKTLTYDAIKEIYEDLKSQTVEERINQSGLNPDRADVIVPAAKIFLTVMKHAGIEKIVVPQVGLSDGIVHLLYEKYKGVLKTA